jgi:hypothetical protein
VYQGQCATVDWLDLICPECVMHLTTVGELEDLYGLPKDTSLRKEVDHLTPEYRAMVEAWWTRGWRCSSSSPVSARRCASTGRRG